MTCRQCEAEMTKEDVSVDLAAHDDEFLDVVITCPRCGHKVNAFMDVDDFEDMD